VRTLFNQRLHKEHPELWAQVPPAVWKTPWNVGAQAAGSGQDALRYLSRYIFKTAMSRFLQHTLPRGFARVRTFGWLHPAAKVRANRVRALLHEKPLLTAAEKQTWHPPVDRPADLRHRWSLQRLALRAVPVASSP
jgi:hypothetical protein